MASVKKQENRELQFEVLGREMELPMTSIREDTPQSLRNPGSGPLPVLVIKADETWRQWVEGATIKYSMVRRNILTKPDFANQMVIAVGTFHVGGITGQGRSREALVSKIVETKDRLLVYVRDGEERVGGGCLGQYFFCVVKLPKLDKKIELVKENDQKRN